MIAKLHKYSANDCEKRSFLIKSQKIKQLIVKLHKSNAKDCEIPQLWEKHKSFRDKANTIPFTLTHFSTKMLLLSWEKSVLLCDKYSSCYVCLCVWV